jgi:hypothetical protein
LIDFILCGKAGTGCPRRASMGQIAWRGGYEIIEGIGWS